MSSSRSISRDIRQILYGSAGVLACLSTGGIAHAQTAGANPVIEEVVVKGIRASYKQSLETKRQSTTVLESITSEDIGKFPDKNVAESLQRVPRRQHLSVNTARANAFRSAARRRTSIALSSMATRSQRLTGSCWTSSPPLAASTT